MAQADPGLLYEALVALETPEEARRFLEDILTVGELQDLAQRITVARLLFEGHTYEEVMRQTGVSNTTISRVRRFLLYGAGGYRLVLERLKARGR